MATQTTKTTEPRNDFKDCLEIARLCREIGGIAEYNAHYSTMLTRKIRESGKPIEDWTLGELKTLNDELGEFYNSLPI